MPKITLANIQSAANQKFSDFEVTLPGGKTATFAPVLRLPKAKRLELAEAFETEGREAGTDIFDLYQGAFRVVARTEESFTELEKAVGDDPAVWKELFEAYSEETEAGEA